MKKALSTTVKVGFLLLLTGNVWGFQGEGTLPTYLIKMQLSSVTATADSNVLLASGPLNLGMVVIGSPTVNQGGPSFIQFYGSTGPVFDTFVITLTPKISLDANQYFSPKDTEWNIFSSSYTWYDKRGVAQIGILYDWVNSASANPRKIFNKYPAP